MSRLARANGSVLIFDVDAAAVDRSAAPARRCQVRLVRVARDGRNGHEATEPGVSAVLVLRALTPSRLLSCVRAVSENSESISPELLCRMLQERTATGHLHPQGAQLTKREFDVLRRLADGDSTRDIAQRLNYSERTVKNIVHDLLAKLNCRTRAQAVALAARQGVI